MRLEVEGKPLELKNDYVIACLGGEPPTEFLKTNGIAMQRLHGEELGAKARGGKPPAPSGRASSKASGGSPSGCSPWAPLIVAILFVIGEDYYRVSLPAAA